MRTATSVAGTMWHHPSAVFLADVIVDEENPMPKAAVLCQAGNDSAMLLKKLQSLVQQAGNIPVPLRAYQSGDVVVFSIGYTADEDVVAMASAKPLKSEATFTAAMANVQQDPLLSIYVNFEHIWSLADTIVAKQNDPQVKEYWPKICQALGLAGLKRLIATAGFDGKDWKEAAYIEAPAPRTGLMTMLDSTPLDDDLLKLAPMDSDHMMAGTFNIAKLIATIHTGVTQVDPNAGAMVDKVIGGVSLYVGRDFQKEVLEPIGEHWVAYSSPTIAGRGLLGAIVINKLADPKKAEQGIMATQIATFNTIAPFMPVVGGQKMTLRAQNMKAGDLSINYLAIPLVSPAWCVNNGNLYIAFFPQNVIGAAHFSASGGKSILDNPGFIDMRKRLGAPDKISGIMYSDLTQTIGEGYQTVLAVSRLTLGMGDLFGVKSPEPVVPPMEVFLKEVGPSGGVTWVDDAGWHSKAVSSFPGAEILGGGNSAVLNIFSQSMPMLGVLLPALDKAKEQAAAVQSMSNLRQIGLGCIMFANDHHGTLPLTLDELVTGQYVKDVRIFVRGAPANDAVASLPPDQQAAWVQEHADYDYLGKGQKLTDIKSASTAPLAYQRDADGQGRTAVLFVDGHVESMKAEELQGVLNR